MDELCWVFLEFDVKWSIATLLLLMHIYISTLNKYMTSALTFSTVLHWSQWFTYITALRNASTNHATTEAMPSYIATYMAIV